MTSVPTWARVTLLALAALVVLTISSTCYLDHVKADAVRDANNAARVDSLVRRVARADTVYRVDTTATRRALEAYRRARSSIRDSLVARVDTLPTGVVVHDTVPMVLVDTEYVTAADSVVRACSLLQSSCARRVAAADSLTEAWRQRYELSKPGRFGLACGPVGGVDFRGHATAGVGCAWGWRPR